MPDTMFNPSQVNIGGSNGGPYLQSEAVRATGDGPFDPTYRQNLATYGGGTFARPGGMLAFNPTDPNSIPGMPTGFGTAPVPGLPGSLLDFGLAGMGFSGPKPQQQGSEITTGSADITSDNSWQEWANKFSNMGSLLRTY